MGGHDHHKPPYVVPEASIYKLESAPELMQVQAKLAEKGLKDPWLRNEVWRYDRKLWGTGRQRMIQYLLKGSKIGVPLFLVTIAVEQVFGLNQSHGHASHGGEHGEHH